MWYALRKGIRWVISALVLLLVTGGITSLYLGRAYGAQLTNRSVRISDTTAGAVATYLLTFDVPNTEVLGSIELQFCSNSPLFAVPCTAPAGFDASSVVLTSQTGEAGFIVLPAATNANTVVLSRVPALAAAGTVSYELSGITNPSAFGSGFARLQTFSSADASGTATDSGGLALSYNAPIQISTTIPPYLYFCVAVTIGGFDCTTASGSYIIMGYLTTQTTGSATSEMVTATNAGSGYTLSVTGTTMTSGNNLINALPVADVSRPGTSQFGLNLRANTTPPIGQDPTGTGTAAPAPGYNQPDFFKFVSGDVVATATQPQEFRKFTTTYLVNIGSAQPIGVYVATLTYVCLANF